MPGHSKWRDLQRERAARLTGGGWAVTIELNTADGADISDARTWAFSTLMHDHHRGVIGASIEGHGRPGYSATFSIDTDRTDPLAVARDAIQIFDDRASQAGLPTGQIVELHLMTFTEQDRQGPT
jgi:hypothetical protein